jgi:hypothetical protein
MPAADYWSGVIADLWQRSPRLTLRYAKRDGRIAEFTGQAIIAGVGPAVRHPSGAVLLCGWSALLTVEAAPPQRQDGHR